MLFVGRPDVLWATIILRWDGDCARRRRANRVVPCPFFPHSIKHAVLSSVSKFFECGGPCNRVSG